MREGYCSRPVCVSVCPSVPTLAASASVETSKQRYSRVSLRLFLDLYVWSFEKNFRSKVMAWKSQYANELELTASRFRAVSGRTKRSSYVKGKLVGRMLLQRLATGATGVKQARYRRGSTRGSEALVRACAVYTQPVYRNSVPLCVWKVLGTCCSM